jgi:tripartite-type tricarboxylate transporter receptor subunit TctC
VKLPRRKFLHLAAGAAAALSAASRMARAQAYSSRPITIVVPFPAGGGLDTVARIIAEPMRASLRQPIIIENATGASGSIGVGRVARHFSTRQQTAAVQYCDPANARLGS